MQLHLFAFHKISNDWANWSTNEKIKWAHCDCMRAALSLEPLTK